MDQEGRGEAQAKGINFRTFLDVFRRLHGESALEGTLHRVDPALGRLLREGAVRAGGWYPVAWYRELHRAAREEVGAGDELSRRIGREATLQDFSGVYMAFLAVLAPETVLRFAPRVMAAYYRPAEMFVARAAPGFAEVRWLHCRGFDRAVWQDLFGGCEGVLHACGARDPRIEVLVGGGDGDEAAEAVARWG